MQKKCHEMGCLGGPLPIPENKVSSPSPERRNRLAVNPMQMFTPTAKVNKDISWKQRGSEREKERERAAVSKRKTPEARVGFFLFKKRDNQHL